MAREYNEYVNADGLYIRKGRGEAEFGRAGEYCFGGPKRVVEVDLVATDLNAFDDSTDPTTVLDYNVRIPPGAFLEGAELQVLSDFVGASATLSIGLANASDMVPAFTHTGDLSAIGIDEEIAVTALQVDDTMPIVCDGSLISTELPSVSDSTVHKGGFLVTAEAGTANFTDGAAKLRIYYSMPVNEETS